MKMDKNVLNKISISVVIPCYNEKLRLSENADIIISFFEKFKDKEIIFVNDGSNDDTLKICLKLKKKYKFVKVISYSQNRGKGYALRRGILKSCNELILITDVDLSTPLNEFYKLGKYYVNEQDVLIGSRALKKSDVVKSQSVFKVFLGRIGNLFIRLVLGLNFNDTQCGFKLFNSKVKDILKNAKINRFGFDFEFLFLLKKENFKIKEVPVIWINNEMSKVRFYDYFITLYELLKVRFYWFFKRYR